MVYVSTTDIFTPGYTINEDYPNLLDCEFIVVSENEDRPLSIIFNSNIEIKEKDVLKVYLYDLFQSSLP